MVGCNRFTGRRHFIRIFLLPQFHCSSGNDGPVDPVLIHFLETPSSMTTDPGCRSKLQLLATDTRPPLRREKNITAPNTSTSNGKIGPGWRMVYARCTSIIRPSSARCSRRLSVSLCFLLYGCTRWFIFWRVATILPPYLFRPLKRLRQMISTIKVLF